MRMIWGVVATGVLLTSVPDVAQAQSRFILLATNRTGTMEDELNAAGADGYRFVGTQGGETRFRRQRSGRHHGTRPRGATLPLHAAGGRAARERWSRSSTMCPRSSKSWG